MLYRFSARLSGRVVRGGLEPALVDTRACLGAADDYSLRARTASYQGLAGSIAICEQGAGSGHGRAMGQTQCARQGGLTKRDQAGLDS